MSPEKMGGGKRENVGEKNTQVGTGVLPPRHLCVLSKTKRSPGKGKSFTQKESSRKCKRKKRKDKELASFGKRGKDEHKYNETKKGGNLSIKLIASSTGSSYYFHVGNGRKEFKSNAEGFGSSGGEATGCILFLASGGQPV